MKCAIKSVSPTQNGDVCIRLADAQIIGRRLVNNAYVIAEGDTINLSMKEWRRALHNVTKGADVAGISAQDAINTVLESIDTNRRIAAATSLQNGNVIDVQAIEFAAGEEIAEGYVAQYDGVRYEIAEVVLSSVANNLLKLMWAQTMGLSPEFVKML